MALKLKKLDQVKVISGKASGKTGKIVRVFKDTGYVLVEGVNLGKKHQRPSQQDQKGGIVEKELPIHISNLVLIDKEGAPVKVVRRAIDGKRVRVEKKSGKALE